MTSPPHDTPPPPARPECPIVIERLPALAAGDVSEPELLLIEAHISGCDRCAAEQAAWDQVIGALDESSSIAPDDLAYANAALARSLETVAPRIRRQRHFIAVAAAVLLASSVGFVATHAPRISLDDLGTASSAFARSFSLPSPRIDSMTLPIPAGIGQSDTRPGRAR